jgi:hypothetical protein
MDFIYFDNKQLPTSQQKLIEIFDAFLPQSQKIMHSLHQLVGSF